MARKGNEKKWEIFLAVLTILLLPAFALAAMSSETFRIGADTINSGGNLDSSENYKMGDSLGEAAIGIESSESYKSKTAFWYMLPGGTQLGLNCQASNVYMMDYTLGNANNYSKYLFSMSEQCAVTDNTNAPWTLTMQSTDMTSTHNDLSNANVFLSTDGNVGSGDTVTTPTTGLSEPATSDYSLNNIRTIISGDATASGTYANQPTVKLTNLNSLYSENISGVITITIQ